MFLCYLIGTTEVYTYADDSLPFAHQVHTRPVIIVHHLILFLLYHLNHALGYTVEHDFARTINLFKLYVAATAAMALALVGVLALRWFGSLKKALVAMFVVGFSYGFWSYAIVTDVYVPAVSFVLLAMYFADKSYEAPKRVRGWTLLFLAGVSVLCAALNHQSHSLAVIPMALVLWLGRREELPWRLRLARSFSFFAITGVLGFVAYYGSYRLSHENVDFITYVRGYSAWMKMMPYDKLQLLTPLYMLVGIGRAFLFPEYALYFDSVYDRLHQHFSLKLLSDDRYVVREMPDAYIVFLLVVIGVLSVAAVWFVVRAILTLWRTPPPAPCFWMLLLWIPIQSILFAWWEATSNEMWIWMLPCVGLIGACLVVSDERTCRGRVLLGLFLTAWVIVNGSVVSRYWSKNNCIYRINKDYLNQLTDQDLAITAYLAPSSEFEFLLDHRPPMIHFRDGAFSFEDTALRQDLARVERNDGRVYLDPILVMPDDTEINLLLYQAQARRDDVVKELLKLEAYCKETGIPLYGVRRRGGDVIRFIPCPFQGYLQWVEQ